MTALKTYTIARRRDAVSHDELVQCWRGTHADGVVAHMAPDGYTLTFFDPRGGEERKLVKRVAARDGEPLLRTPEGSLLPAGSLYEQGARGLLRVPRGCLFVEGDNPGFSDDSRRGWLVPRPLVVGTVKAVLFPLSRFRLIP